MKVKELIKAGKADLVEDLYKAALTFIDATMDEKSIKDIDEAEDRLFMATNQCTAALSKLNVIRDEIFKPLRKNKEDKPISDLIASKGKLV